jgi:acyl-CoA thioester hydrolase
MYKDNDQYGHVNNAVYQSLFDSTVNVYLIRFCNLDVTMGKANVVAFIVENFCQFFEPVASPSVCLGNS